MICILKHEHRRDQLQIFIEKNNLHPLFFSTTEEVEKYFSNLGIHLNFSHNYICNRGWDYLSHNNAIYFMLDLNWNLSVSDLGIFVFDSEIGSISGLCKFLKAKVRQTKLQKLIC